MFSNLQHLSKQVSIFKFNSLFYLILTLFTLSACSTGRNPFSYSDPKQLNTVVSYALSMKGIAYRYGGSDPKSGFDCSGLVQYAYSKAGIKLPRTTYQQFRHSSPIYLSQIRPGDLLFYRINNSIVSHVAIYLGNKQFIHAPRTGKSVSIEQLNTPFWEKRFVGAGKIIN